MNLSIRQENPDPATTVLHMDGRLLLGPDTVEVEELVQRFLNENRTRLVFDLAAVSHMDSTGMGRFIDAHQKLTAAGRSMRIAGLTGGVREMFRVTKLDTVFDLYPTVEAAIAAP
jgi:anti-sigma B factor antagonist